MQAGKIPVVIFSNPYPVTSATIELYAVQARMPLHVRGEYFDAWTLIPGMCLLDSLSLLVVRVVRIYRRGDPGCGTAAPASR